MPDQTVATLVAQLKLDLGNFQKSVQDLDNGLTSARRGLEGSGTAAEGFTKKVAAAEERVGALGIQSATLTRGLALLSSPLTIVGAALGAVAAVSYSATEAMKENARAVQNLVAVSGLSAEQADNLADTFGVLGFESEQVANAMFRMGAEIESGGAGLGRLGISLRDSSGALKAEGQLFLEVRDRISELGTASERTAALQDIFGRGARALAPVFAMNREEFQRWMNVASGLSPWSDEAQQKTIELIRAQNQLSAAWSGLKEAIGTLLVGPATETVTWMSALTVKVRELLERLDQVPLALARMRENLEALMQVKLPPFQLPGPLGALIETARGAPPVRAGLPEEEAGALPRGTGATGLQPTRRTTAEFAQDAAESRAALQARMVYYDRLAALRAEAVAAEQTDQKILLQGALADFAQREAATRQYFGRQRALIVEQFGSTEAAARTKLAELDAAQTSALGGIEVSRINARAQLAALQVAETKKIQEQEIAGWVAVAEEEFRLTEQRLNDEVRAADAAAAEAKQMEKEAQAGWVAAAEAAFEETERVQEAFAKMAEPVRAFFDEAQKLKQTLTDIETRGAAIRKVGGTFDVSGSQQRAVESRFGDLAVQMQQWEAVKRNLDETNPRFQELQANIERAGLEMDTLSVKLQDLQQLNAIKAVVSDIFGALNRAISTSITGVIQGTITTKQAFENMGQSILLSIQEVIIKRAFRALEMAFDQMLDQMDQRAVTSGALGLLGKILGSFSGGGAGIGESATSTGTSPAGADITRGVGAEGAIVTRPTRALIGEAGAEMVVPLHAMPGASPLRMGGGGDGGLVVIVNNYTGGEVETSEGMSADGKRQLEIMVHEAVRRGIGGGGFDHILQGTYGLTRQGTRR